MTIEVFDKEVKGIYVWLEKDGLSVKVGEGTRADAMPIPILNGFGAPASSGNCLLRNRSS